VDIQDVSKRFAGGEEYRGDSGGGTDGRDYDGLYSGSERTKAMKKRYVICPGFIESVTDGGPREKEDLND